MRDLSSWHSDSSLWCSGFSLFVAAGFLFSSCGAQAPERMGSVVCGMQALVETSNLSSFGTQA